MGFIFSQWYPQVGAYISITRRKITNLCTSVFSAEGRTWYTSYRGKLWIASTGVKLSRQEAVKYENMYRLIKGGK